jgi:hypothetical protein
MLARSMIRQKMCEKYVYRGERRGDGRAREKSAIKINRKAIKRRGIRMRARKV